LSHFPIRGLFYVSVGWSQSSVGLGDLILSGGISA